MRVSPWGARGSIALFSVAVLIAACAFFGLLVEHGVASVVAQRQQAQLQSCSGVLASQTFSVMAKNDDHPGRLTASVTCRQLRSLGYKGRVTVWYWETSAADGNGAKAAVWGVQIGERLTTPLSAVVGISSLPVASYAADWRLMWSAVWADEGRPWRPASPDTGVFVLEAGEDPPSMGDEEGVLSFQGRSSLDGFPEEVRGQAEQAQRAARELDE